EIASSAGQEGLPIPNFESPPASESAPAFTSAPTESESAPAPTGADLLRPSPIYRPPTHALTQFKTQLEGAIRSTEREIATLDGKLDLLPELKAQVDVHQATLDALLVRKQVILERGERFHTPGSLQQIENARQQQVTLRNALRSLQDSLRERVQKLGV